MGGEVGGSIPPPGSCQQKENHLLNFSVLNAKESIIILTNQKK